MTPTREIPSISLNDMYVSKHRGNYQTPKKVQVKSGELQRPVKSNNIELKMTQITPATQKIISPDITNVKPTPLVNPRKGDYILNRTQSTGGIAAKISLELKKKYLLDTSALAGNIQRSGSATALDSKLKSFHSNISEHQKLLNPAPEISPTMQAFLQGTSKLHQPLSPSITPKSPTFIDNKFEQIFKEESEKKLEKTTELKSPEIIESSTPNNKISMQPDITKDLIEDQKEKCDSSKEYQPDVIYTNDTEGRPRSPVHETSIIVPEIAWAEVKPEKKSETDDIDSDSLSSESDINEEKSPNKVFSEIPRVEIHDSSGELLQDDDIAMDSLCIIPERSENSESLNKIPSIVSEPPKSIQSEKKSLNQPKVLPIIENGFTKCHDVKETNEEKLENSSGRSTPISISEFNDGTAAALTETELSDWARDGAVSDNLEDVEIDIFGGKKLKHRKKRPNAKIAMVEDFEDHICGKTKLSTQNGVPIADFDSIEFMDTGSEVSVEDVVQTTNPVVKNRGYVQFVHEEQKVIEDLPNNNPVVEAVNENFNIPPSDQNTGYCVFGNEDEENYFKINDQRSESELKICDNEDDSLLNVETGTTTEENTCSDSTVKNLNERSFDNLPRETVSVENQLEDVENNTEEKVEEIPTPVVEEKNCSEYDEHIQRLQYKYAEFGFVKDSIDIRKSKRKSKTQSPPSNSEQSDTQLKEIPASPTPAERTSPPSQFSPSSKKLDEINKERNKQKDLIHDLVMDKVKTQRRSLDKRRKLRDSFSPSNSPVRSFDLSKSATVSVLAENNNSKNLSLSLDSYKTEKPALLQKSPTVIGIPERNEEKENTVKPEIITLQTDTTTPKRPLLRPLSVIEPLIRPKLYKETSFLPDTSLTNPETFSMPDIHHVIEEFKTPIAPPRTKNDEAKRTAEKFKLDAKARAKMMSDEELGLSPEEKIKLRKERLLKKRNGVDDCVQDSIESLVLNTEKRNALLNEKKIEGDLHNSFSSTDITNKLSHYSEDILDPRNRTKSVSEISHLTNEEELKKSLSGNIIQRTESQKRQLQFYKSDPNLLTENNKEKKSKDRERRKSIIKSVTDFFHKKKDVKSPTSGVKEKFSRFRISPKSKEKSKVFA